MTKLYSDQDVQPEALKGQRIVILGYGSQGRAQAMNLRDSGFDVPLALRPGGKTWAQAEADGFKPKEPSVALKDAHVISMLLPDTDSVTASGGRCAAAQAARMRLRTLWRLAPIVVIMIPATLACDKKRGIRGYYPAAGLQRQEQGV